MTKAHVLAVDDEAGIATLCQRVLTRAGYQVTAFDEPIKGRDYLDGHHVDLLLVDIRMPVLSGFDLIKAAYARQPELAVLVMTGFGTVETAIEALHEGVDGLILKPFERDELLAAVERALADNQKKRDSVRMRALHPLFDLTEALIAETHSDPLTARVVEAVCNHLGCTHAGVYRYSDADRELHLLGGRGCVLDDSGIAQEGGIVARALTQNAPVSTSVGHLEPDLQAQIDKLQLGAVMCAPTTLPNMRTVIFAGRDAGQPPFREVDLETLLILARQATIAIENARLYEELRAYVQRVEDSQAALVQAEKLSTAGRMIASIAHEINNPLQALRNCLHLVGRKDLPIERREEYLQMAQSELERLATTVQRMLNFYRPNVARESVRIPDLLEHVLSLLGQQLNQNGVRVRTECQPGLPAVMAVGSQIQQVFINLILNAIDAMPHGGELRITAGMRDTMLAVDFQDNGPGVPVELRAAVFEPFTSTKQGGTGLGLSVSYGIISAHGGRLELLADQGPGACFRITLPEGKSQ